MHITVCLPNLFQQYSSLSGKLVSVLQENIHAAPQKKYTLCDINWLLCEAESAKKQNTVSGIATESLQKQCLFGSI